MVPALQKPVVAVVPSVAKLFLRFQERAMHATAESLRLRPPPAALHLFLGGEQLCMESKSMDVEEDMSLMGADRR